MNKIVNFTNQESSESTNVLEEYVEYLRTMAVILEGYDSYAQDVGSSVVAAIGLDFSKFSFVPEESDDFPDTIMTLTYMYKSKKAVYKVIFDFDIEEDSVTYSMEKHKNGVPYLYNFEERMWEEDELDIPKELEEILDEDTLEADFVRKYIGSDPEGTPTKGYEELRKKYSALYDLYEKTHTYMDPSCYLSLYEEKPSLYLRPKDLFRHGFVVGCDSDTYILYQEAGISEHWKKPYVYEVGRTNDIVEMENCLNKLANRYTDEDIFTLPLSLDAFTESTDAENLGKDFIMDDRTQLTQKEVENFYSGKKAMKKLEQYI